MLDDEDIAGVDHWIGCVTRGAKCLAWERIKTKHAEALKPSHNTQRDEIIAKIQLYIDKICDAHNDVRYDISALSVLREVRRIILQ